MTSFENPVTAFEEAHPELFNEIFPGRTEMLELWAGEIGQYIAQRRAMTGARIDVTELGCGAGTSTAYVVALDQRVHVYAVDNNIFSLNRAKSRNLPRVEYGIASIEDPRRFPIFSNPAVVCSSFAFHEVPPKERTEVLRFHGFQMADGGLLAIADILPPRDYGLFKPLFEDQLRRISSLRERGLGEVADELEEHIGSDYSPSRYWSLERAVHDVKSAGFRNVEVKGLIGLRGLITARAPSGNYADRTLR
jgi:SAM-dependent methyltransferase